MKPLTKSQLLFSASITHTTVTDRNRGFFKIPKFADKNSILRSITYDIRSKNIPVNSFS